MPGMDGCEVCRQLKENPDWKDIPVIFLSAADDKDLIVRALDSGGVDYITKPFNQAELISRVRTQLALKTARDRLKQLAEDKDELLGILAHDLKNYLGGINMSAELLQRADRALQRRTPDAIVGKHAAFQRAGAGFRERISRQLRDGSWFHLETRRRQSDGDCHRRGSAISGSRAAKENENPDRFSAGSRDRAARMFPRSTRFWTI